MASYGNVVGSMDLALVQRVQIDLIWRTADGTFQCAPWRSTDWEYYVNAINEGRWLDCYPLSLPIG